MASVGPVSGVRRAQVVAKLLQEKEEKGPIRAVGETFGGIQNRPSQWPGP